MLVDMLEAKNQLSRLVQAALAGEDVIIANKGVPVVRLVKIGVQAFARKPGAWSEPPPAAEDWDAPETNAELAETLTDGKLP
jgi:prevent-host-death family protein